MVNLIARLLRSRLGGAVVAALGASITATLFVVLDIPGRWVDGWPVLLQAVAYVGVGILIGVAMVALREASVIALARRGAR